MGQPANPPLKVRTIEKLKILDKALSRRLLVLRGRRAMQRGDGGKKKQTSFNKSMVHGLFMGASCW